MTETSLKIDGDNSLSDLTAVISTPSAHLEINKACFPGKYIQGNGALSMLPDLINLFGGKCLVLASQFIRENVIPKYHFFHNNENILIEKFNGECCEAELKRLADIIAKNNIKVLACMGGGKTIDTAKIAADRAGIPVIIIPTIASSDAPCSGCAVIYTESGIFESVYYQKMNPEVVLVDLKLISEAPVRYLIAGIGDALATWYEANSCSRTKSMNECGGYSTLTGHTIAALCRETLFEYAEAAISACENHIVTPALAKITEANTLLSGIGFESAGLAAAHSIHNGLTALPETRKFLHGEKVAFGLLASLHLTDTSPDETDRVYSFCEKIGLPTTFSEIGITYTNRARLLEVSEKAVAAGESIHKEAGTITAGKVLNALIAADVQGRKRRKVIQE